MQNEIRDINFFSAGNATFTVFNNKKEHYTYKIRKKETQEGKDIFFASLMSGPDNEYSFSYLGIYNPAQCRIYVTEKSRYKKDSLVVNIIKWAIEMIRVKAPIPAGYGIIHEGKCCRCGRKLTTPRSVEIGIGPECEKIMSN